MKSEARNPKSEPSPKTRSPKPASDVFILPGLGGDHRMYPEPWPGLPGAVILDWPAYRNEQSVEAMAARVVETAGIPDDSVVIGSSLGGMVACEIARLRRLRGLVLLGSAVQPREVSRLLHLLHPLADIAPFEFLRVASSKLPHDVTQMFARTEAPFMRAMCRAIFKWPGWSAPDPRPLRIHGSHDHIIPPPANPDLLLDGGHLISMTHAKECVHFLQPWLQAGCPER
jgi:pimeloyl-ACP methyl ester carboxylesterase